MAPTQKKCDWEKSKAWGAYKSSKMIYSQVLDISHINDQLSNIHIYICIYIYIMYMVYTLIQINH
jgi:hypothetical protein